MAQYAVIRHTFTQDEIRVLLNILDRAHKHKDTPELDKLQLAGVINKLATVHRLSISYVVPTDKK